MIPTYNEATNVERMINDVLNCGADAQVLIVDDMSPDKTYKIVQKIAETNPKVHLLLRKEKKGRGHAGKEGFKKAAHCSETVCRYVYSLNKESVHDRNDCIRHSGRIHLDCRVHQQPAGQDFRVVAVTQ